MWNYTPCYRLELREWLNTIERKPNALTRVSQSNDSNVAEKPRPERVSNYGKKEP